MSFLYYILSLQNPCQSKLDNKKEPSILIELLLRHENRCENKLDNEYLVLYGGKNELEINFILVNEPCIYGGKIHGKMNFVLIK